MSELSRKDKSFVWHPFTQHQTEGDPIVITRAEGTKLFGEDGKEYIDANSSWWVNVHGHGHPHLQKAIAEQFMQIDHIIFAGCTHPKAIELSERILDLLPDKFEKVFFSDNGSTSVEVALKMAFQYWYNLGRPKKRIVAMDGAYHGDTFGAMSVGQRGYFNEPFEHLFFDVDFIPFPDGSNDNEVLNKAEQLFATGETAAFIIEPLVQGSAGMRMYSQEMLDKLVTLARTYEVLVIFDEVMTGFGRTGKLFAMDHCRHKPDIVSLSKGLTGGVLPLGLTIAGNTVFDAFLAEEKAKALLHGHSFTGNALSCAAACASLDLFDHAETFQKIDQISRWNAEFLQVLSERKDIRNPRMTGTILAFEIAIDNDDSYFANIRDKAYTYFIENSVLIRPLGNTLFINPPYSITEEEYHSLSGVIVSFMDSL